MESKVQIDTKEFQTLFHMFYEGLCRYAQTIVKEQSIAEDLVQDLFIKIWEKRHELSDVQNMKSYLFQSVYNLSINEVKRMVRVRDKSTNINLPNSNTVDASVVMMGEELKSKIERTMESLPKKCGEVFILSRFEDLSYKEIAERLNISIKTVENHMGKALRLMREGLSEYLPMVLITIILSKGW